MEERGGGAGGTAAQRPAADDRSRGPGCCGEPPFSRRDGGPESRPQRLFGAGRTAGASASALSRLNPIFAAALEIQDFCRGRNWRFCSRRRGRARPLPRQRTADDDGRRAAARAAPTAPKTTAGPDLPALNPTSRVPRGGSRSGEPGGVRDFEQVLAVTRQDDRLLVVLARKLLDRVHRFPDGHDKKLRLPTVVAPEHRDAEPGVPSRRTPVRSPLGRRDSD